MSRFAICLFMAASWSSGCSGLDLVKGKESRFAPAVVPEQTTVRPEPDPVQASAGKPTDKEYEQLPVALPVSESTGQKVSGNSGVEKGHDQEFGSWLILPDLRNEWAASVGNKQRPIAGDLWNLGLAGPQSSLFDNGRIGTKKVSVGISETPYNCLNDALTAVNASVKVAHGEDRAWFFGWSYSGTGKQPYPVPRIQHTWHISERIRVNAGVIFPNMVDPTFDLSLSIRR